MNNNFNNFNRQLPQGALMGPRTNTAIKFSIIMLLGILPLLLCSLFITATGMADQFKQWGSAGSKASTEINYGFMWLMGIAIYIAMFPLIIILTKITKEVKLDVIPGTSAAGLAMLNMFVIPHTNAAFLILSLPSFAIIGFIIGAFVMIVTVLKTIQKQVTKFQKDPQFENVMKEFEKQIKGAGMNIPNPKNPTGKVENKDYKNNPYVDIPDEDEEEK